MKADEDHAPWLFFGLVLILSVPFYALGATGAALPFVPALPISAVMVCVPVIASLALSARQGGAVAAGALFKSAFNFRSIPNAGWVVLGFGIMPIAFALTAGLVWLTGTPLPTLQLLPVNTIIAAFATLFLGAVGEELGWQGYAYPALAKHHSALTAALVIGVVWALWHVIPFALMGRDAGWIFWHSLGIVLMRIIIVWLVVNAGQSILIAVLFHMMSNSVWGMFPDFMPFYDPMVMCLVLLAPVIAVVTIWGPTTLGQFRYG